MQRGRKEESARRKGPEPSTTKEGIQAGRAGDRGSREGDTKCINVPPQTLLRGGGGQRLQPGAWGGSGCLLAGDPTGMGTA